MHILIAPDKFKGSARALEVAEALRSGLQVFLPKEKLTVFPVADGGDGFAEILGWHHQAERQTALVSDPLGRPVRADYYLASDGNTAFMEMAAAAGLVRLAESERNPSNTSTVGVGEMIRDAVEKGAKRIILGIGGSATNDLGLGAASVFGLKLLDVHGESLAPIGGNLDKVAAVNLKDWAFPEDVTIEVACDVTNPLCGPDGAARVYAPQKGADEEMVNQLDRGLSHLRDLWLDATGLDLQEIPGGGAAGGLGAGMAAFFQAKLMGGMELMIRESGLDKIMSDVDLIITGEGRLDEQTASGKVVQGIARLASSRQIPVIAVAGSLETDATVLDTLGLTYATTVCPGPVTLQSAMEDAVPLLRQCGARLGLLIRNMFQP